jgi:hypothetical protein
MRRDGGEIRPFMLTIRHDFARKTKQNKTKNTKQKSQGFFCLHDFSFLSVTETLKMGLCISSAVTTIIENPNNVLDRESLDRNQP